MATWATTKQQAAEMLGLQLVDTDVLNIPMLVADPYGNFIPGPRTGCRSTCTATGLVEGEPPANAAGPVPANVAALRHPVPDRHRAQRRPVARDTDNNPATPPVAPRAGRGHVASADFAASRPARTTTRCWTRTSSPVTAACNENIGADRDPPDLPLRARPPGRRHQDRCSRPAPPTPALAALPSAQLGADVRGYGERLFQAARFVTEMEYQHLVFEEFARKIQPAINPFEPFAFTQTDLNPAIRAEFAHAVYRFGHSMLTETISADQRADGSGQRHLAARRLPEPAAYTDGGTAGTLTAEQAAGSIIMGMSDQVGNELDEFVTDTLRNNLLGLPLDLRRDQHDAGPLRGHPAAERRCAASSSRRPTTGSSRRTPAGSTSARTSSTRSRWSTSWPPTASTRTDPSPADGIAGRPSGTADPAPSSSAADRQPGPATSTCRPTLPPS